MTQPKSTEAAHYKLSTLDSCFGAVITDIKLTQCTENDITQLRQDWVKHGLLIFPEQHLSKAAQIALAKRMGSLELPFAELSNVKKDGTLRQTDDDMVRILKGNMGWHHDSTYMPKQARGAFFSAKQVPSKGGNTAWADTTAAYQAMDEDLKARIQHLSAYHSLSHSQKQAGFIHKSDKDSEYSGYGMKETSAPLRSIVAQHPESKQTVLTIGRHAYGIPGLSETESEALLEELHDFVCRAPRIYEHHWQAGDIVLWDNYRLLHKGCPWDMNEARVMYHSRIAGSL